MVLMKVKIKEILQKMIDTGEFDKIIDSSKKGLTPYKEVDEIKAYVKELGHSIDMLDDIQNIPILPLIFEMPQAVAADVLCALLNCKVEELTDEEKKGIK